ncbi:hypothetical protein CMV_022860 [Castanea mollissima]|uniref:RNase H type-1 domain-containing protein n=1 Tax=Castanea mollissima TaxID=60419 RepID=A0A8J4QD35_9ROSI|nr:hypothetical protein CMV_022860 [Castanea mollissima]
MCLVVLWVLLHTKSSTSPSSSTPYLTMPLPMRVQSRELLLKLSLQLVKGQIWATKVVVTKVERSEVVLAKIFVFPNLVWGWSDLMMQSVWRMIVSVTKVSAKEGGLLRLVWTTIKKGREVFNKGSMWLVSRDNDQSFWNGNWIKGGPMRQRIQGPLTRKDDHLECFSGKALNLNLSSKIENHSTEFMYWASSPRCPIPRVVVACRWEKPPEGWIKLNSDGCAAGSPGLAGYGGVERDSHGEWVSGFSRHIGIMNSFVAELWGLRDGLVLCSNLNIPSLIVEMDTKSIVDIFSRDGYVNDVISPILDDCRMLITKMEGENVPLGKRKRNPAANSDSTFTSRRPTRFFIDAKIDHLVIAIKYSLLLDMSKNEAVEYISTHAKVHPQAVGLVWDRLELQNPNVFNDYNKRIQSKIQKRSTKNSAPPKVPLPPKGNFLLYHFMAMKLQHCDL